MDFGSEEVLTCHEYTRSRSGPRANGRGRGQVGVDRRGALWWSTPGSRVDSQLVSRRLGVRRVG